MIYFYYGEDSFRTKQTIDILRNKFIELYDPAGHNIELLDVSDFTLERFFSSLHASGFLASKKMVIARNIFSHKKLSEIQDPIIEYLTRQKNTKEENYLAFWQDGVPRQNLKLFKKLSAVCSKNCIRNFERLEGSSIAAWIRAEAQREGTAINPDAVELLVSLTGNDTWRLHHEIRKLCSTAEHTISVRDVERITTARGGESIFPFVDALGSRDATRALQLLESSFRSGAEPLYLLNMIERQFRLIVRAKELNVAMRNSFAAARSLGLPQFVTKKIVQQSSNFTRDELVEIFRNLVDLDVMIKTGAPGARGAMTLFVSKLSS